MIDLGKAINDNDILMVEFGSSTCPPCASIRAKLSQFSADNGIPFIYIAYEDNMSLSAEYDVYSAPTLLVYVMGKLTIRESGYFGLEPLYDRIMRYQDMLADR